MVKEDLKPYVNRVSIKLVSETKTDYCITGSEDAKSFLSDYLAGYDREHFVALLLSTKNHIQSVYEVSVGTLNQSAVHPREVFKAAILANANAIIVGHNHPSGDVTPSVEDMLITDRIKEGGKLLGIEVFDHIIVTGAGDSYSFKEHGM